MNKEPKRTSHHIVPRSKGGSNEGHNLKSMKENIHVAFHQVFLNKEPHEQIATLLDINHTALTRIFKKEIYEILNEASNDGWIYRNGIYRK